MTAKRREVLEAIYAYRGGKLTCRELGMLTGFGTGAIKAMVDRLERDGFVEPRIGTGARVVLSAAGRQAVIGRRAA